MYDMISELIYYDFIAFINILFLDFGIFVEFFIFLEFLGCYPSFINLINLFNEEIKKFLSLWQVS